MKGACGGTLGDLLGECTGRDRYVHTSPDISVYLHSTSKQKSEQGGHFSPTKVTFPNAGKLLPGQLGCQI